MAEMTKDEIEYLKAYAKEKEDLMRFFTGMAKILSCNYYLNSKKIAVEKAKEQDIINQNYLCYLQGFNDALETASNQIGISIEELFNFFVLMDKYERIKK
ncbi:hypothetical protein J7E63_16715 [Bacillus sp. ISL-75]|uniref:hypothetical protein n=1 Tax=Bacillus sp. ISL-75 TaxID=2819137 RepID=UPI001BE611AD|nr:hypothetical protein [Bacillus sp. ISL-75]MBT2728569.1 hypothetical protein [Bacillus sp. ISL-75]